MSKANVQTKYHLAAGVTAFRDLFMLAGQYYSLITWRQGQHNVRSSIIFVSLSGFREIYGRCSVPPNIYFYFSKPEIPYGREQT